MDDSAAVFGIGYRDRSGQSGMHAYLSRYHLDCYSWLLTGFDQVSKLVVHYFRTAYASMQNRFGEHYRNHRGMGTREYLLTFQPSGYTCFYRFLAVGVGCQYRGRISFYL